MILNMTVFISIAVLNRTNKELPNKNNFEFHSWKSLIKAESDIERGEVSG